MSILRLGVGVVLIILYDSDETQWDWERPNSSYMPYAR